MKHLITIFFHILIISISVQAAENFTISRKNRVIQEASTQKGQVSVDSQIGNYTFSTLKGNTYQLDTLTKQGPVIFVFLSTECPVAQRYTMRLRRTHAEFTEKNVTLVGVYANENDSLEDVQTYVQKAEFPFLIVKDTDGSLARHLGATMTPQVHLIDSSNTLRYRGPIDDNRIVTRVKHTYLKEALVAVLDGKKVSVKETPAFGCTIHLPELPNESDITYSEHIAPLIQKNCQTCHQQDRIAPLTFSNYADAKTHATKIAKYTQAKLMPLWRLGQGYGDFKNERRLTASEIEMFTKWVEAGTPKGPIVKAEPNPQPSDTWTHGEPDLVIKTANLNELPQGHDIAISLVIPTNFEEEKYVRGIDFQLDSGFNIRRINAVIGSERKSQKMDSAEDGATKSVDKPVAQDNMNRIDWTWTPGIVPNFLPDGIGHLLPKRGEIILEMQLHNSDNQADKSMLIGVYFTNKTETTKLHKVTMTGYSNQQNVVSSYRLKKDVYILNVYPSLQVYKHDMRIVAITPTGEQIKMLWVMKSDFKWNEVYHYNKPIFLPAGTRLEFEDIETPNPELSNQKNESLICHFYFVLASEYKPE